MALPAIPDELLVEILLRLPTAADLIRASAACVSFRRLIADRSFPRRFRKLHPPPLLGFLDPERHRFHPAVPPHPSAPAARAVASAADFSFGFLPSPSRRWFVQEVRDGRVLLDRPRRLYAGEVFGPLFKEMVVCDPLHRHYLALPRIPDDLAASVVGAQGSCYADSFLVPSGYDEEAAVTEEPSFRVIWMVLLQNKPVIAVFCSGTGQWRAVPSPTWSEMSPGFVSSTLFFFLRRHYAHGCFYWISGSTEKLLVLDIRRMELSVADHPPCERNPDDDVAILEADQGTTLMFVPKRNTSPVTYTVWRNNGGSSTQWQMEKTFSPDSGSLLTGAVGRHLLLYHCGSSSVERGCSTCDVDTFELERVCAAFPKPSHIYCNFPPSLLSSPTVSRGTHHADVQGAGDDVPVPGLREADPGGMQGTVVAAAARARNPLFVVEATPHADVRQAGDAVRVPELREAGPEGVTLCNAATAHADVWGAGDAVAAREAREAGPGGVQGPAIASAAQSPNPLFDNNGEEVGRGGARRRRRWRWGWAWTCGGCRAG